MIGLTTWEKKGLSIVQQNVKNPMATWISTQQREAIVAIAKRQRDVMALLKTGGGKSMLAIVPAMLFPHEAVVVVLPLRSLIMDWHHKLTAMDIAHQIFDPSQNRGRLDININLILVSADKAKYSSWRTALAEFHQTVPMTCMVFDEAHIVLLACKY